MGGGLGFGEKKEEEVVEGLDLGGNVWGHYPNSLSFNTFRIFIK